MSYLSQSNGVHSAFLGHSNPATTASIYCTPDFQQLIGLLRLPWHSESGGVVESGDDTLLCALATTTDQPSLTFESVSIVPQTFAPPPHCRRTGIA